MKRLILFLLVTISFLCGINAQHFTTVWDGNTGLDHHNFYIFAATIDGVDMEAGDEIGIFDGPNCVGAGILTGPILDGSYLEIRCSADDPITTGVTDGYIAGNSPHFLIWDSGTGTLLSGGDVETTLTGMSVFTVSGSSFLFINGNLPCPTPDPPGSISGRTTICEGRSETYSIAAVTNASSYTWILPSGWSGSSTTTSINAITGASGNISVTANNTCGSSTPSTLSVTGIEIPAIPIVGPIQQPTCTLSTGSVELGSLPASGTWTLTRSPGGISIAGTGTNTTISGLAPGTYTYTVSNESGCTSASSENIVIDPLPATPSSPVIGTISQPSCSSATGSVNLSGLPASGTWTLTTFPGATTSTGTGTSTIILNLTPETYTFTVSNESGCTSELSSEVVINAHPETPSSVIIGTITHPTLDVPVGSVELSGLPPSGTWTLTIHPYSRTITGTGTSTTITELDPDTYTFTVENASGCVSAPSDDVFINCPPHITGQHAITVLEEGSVTISVDHLIIFDSDNTPSEMTVSVAPQWNYTVSGGNTITPNLDYFGSLTVLVAVNDGIISSGDFSANVTVTPVNDAPLVSNIADQSIVAGESFDAISLDDYIVDAETSDENIVWSYTGNTDLLVDITNRVATISVPNTDWSGTETITFTGSDDDSSPLSDSDDVQFTVAGSADGIYKLNTIEIKAYPNPTSGKLFLGLSKDLTGKTIIRITNSLGQVVLTKSFDFAEEIIVLDVHSLIRGMYQIEVINEKEQWIFPMLKE